MRKRARNHKIMVEYMKLDKELKRDIGHSIIDCWKNWKFMEYELQGRRRN